MRGLTDQELAALRQRAGRFLDALIVVWLALDVAFFVALYVIRRWA